MCVCVCTCITVMNHFTLQLKVSVPNTQFISTREPHVQTIQHQQTLKNRHVNQCANTQNPPTPTERGTDLFTHTIRTSCTLKQEGGHTHASHTVPSQRTGDQIYSALGFLNLDPITAIELRTTVNTKHTYTSAHVCVKGYTECSV